MMNKLKKYKLFRPLILSRHPSHSILRAKNQTLPLLPFRSVIRLGSTTESDGRLEINTTQAVKNSASKLLMKQKFTEAGVKTAEWFKWIEEDTFLYNNEEISIHEMLNKFPKGIVMKKHYGSKGLGNTYVKNIEDWENFKNR